MVSDDVMVSAALPTVAAREHAHVVMASSAISAYGSFYDHAMLGATGGSDTIRTYKWALADCEWISPTAIAAAKESMSDLRFRAEYLGEFASNADSLFSKHVLDRVLCDRALYSLDALQGPARLMGGVDWGAVNDSSTLCALGRVPGEPTLCVVCAYKWPAGTELTLVTNAIATSPAHFGLLTVETNGLGLPLSQETVRLYRERPTNQGGGRAGGSRVVNVIDLPEGGGTAARKTPSAWGRPRMRPQTFTTMKRLHHVTAQSKAAAYSALRMLIERQQLVIPRSAEDLTRELLLLRVDLSPSGNERIEASTGHDDLADALAHSLGPYKLEDGSWRTDAARVMERPVPTPSEAVDPSDMTAYQSVAGPELSAVSVPAPPAQYRP